MISRRRIIGGGTSAWVAAPFVAAAQPAGRVWRLGILSLFPDTAPHFWLAFEKGLEARGYFRGKNLVIEQRSANGIPERLPERAAELVRLNVDLIVTGGNQTTAAAARATTTIPIVFMLVVGPLEAGFVISLARPGKNLTGLSYDAAPEAAAKALEYLREIVPQALRIACFRYRGVGSSPRYFEELERAARAFRIQLEIFEIQTVGDIDQALALIARQRPDALFVPPSVFLYVRRKQIIAFAAEHRLPAAYGNREFAEAGGLISFGTDAKDIFRRASIYVDKILRGAHPAEIPVEQPTKFELVINLKTANALGLAIPSALLTHADEVIE